jgi:hypothetical protein
MDISAVGFSSVGEPVQVYVTRDIGPWTIKVGSPAQPLTTRPSETMTEHAWRLGLES